MPADLVIEDLLKVHNGRDRTFRLEIPHFRLAAGEALAVIGASGSGKSTFLDLVGLASRPQRCAAMRLEDRDAGVTDLAAIWAGRGDEELAGVRRRSFGYVLQGGELLSFLSVHDNVSLPQRLAGRLEPSHLRTLFERLGLADLTRARPPELSFGQRQRVAIARALAHRPDLVLADEPTAALDPENARNVVALMLELSRAQQTSLVIVSHDHGLLDRLQVPTVTIANLSDATGSKSVLAHEG